MKRLLIVANETVGGTPLIDAVKKHAEAGDVAVTVVCPQNQPKGGWVIYDESAKGAARNRLDTTLASLREIGIEAEGDTQPVVGRRPRQGDRRRLHPAACRQRFHLTRTDFDARALDRAAQDVNDPPFADGRLPKMQDVGQFGAH